MSVCLKYFWVEKYGCLENTGFQFDDKLEFTYDTEKNILNMKPVDMELEDDFWEPTGRLANIHAVIGDNGYGKTTFLRALMDAFSQIYPSAACSSEEYVKSDVKNKSLMVVKNEEVQKYQVLCIGIKVESDNLKLSDAEVIDDKLQIRDILRKVKVAFFSNHFDFRDYSVPKANHISDYSFGGLLRGDFDKQLRYQREDRQDDPVSEYFYHGIYRQVSFLAEFYGTCLEADEQKRMFDSWPEFLHIYFHDLRGAQGQKINFRGIFLKVLEQYIIESDIITTGHGVSPTFFVEKRLSGVLENKITDMGTPYDKVRYRLCRESFRNLLMCDDYMSFYQEPNHTEMGEELMPVVRGVCSAIETLGDPREGIVNLPAEKIFLFYKSLQEILEQISEKEQGRAGAISGHYGKMIKVALNMPEDLFVYTDSQNGIGFDFRMRGQKPETIKKFSEFLEAYKGIVLPFSFLGFDWGMSSGENHMLSIYSQLFAMREAVKATNLHTERVLNYIWQLGEKPPGEERFEKAACDTIWILIDEADLSFHPKWQKEFISNCSFFFPKILPDKKTKIYIIFTTHSPILLGDMPKQNVIYLSRNDVQISAERRLGKNTFGQNLYMLFDDSFSLHAPMGKFASDKIRDCMNALLGLRENLYETGEYISVENLGDYQNQLDMIHRDIGMIGDKVLRYKLMDLADVCQYYLDERLLKVKYGNEEKYFREELDRLSEKQEWVKKQLKNLERGGNDLDKIG